MKKLIVATSIIALSACASNQKQLHLDTLDTMYEYINNGTIIDYCSADLGDMTVLEQFAKSTAVWSSTELIPWKGGYVEDTSYSGSVISKPKDGGVEFMYNGDTLFATRQSKGYQVSKNATFGVNFGASIIEKAHIIEFEKPRYKYCAENTRIYFRVKDIANRFNHNPIGYDDFQTVYDDAKDFTIKNNPSKYGGTQ